MGHAHDGDAKVRKATYQLFRKHPSRKVGDSPANAYITIDHPLIQLIIPRVCVGMETVGMATAGMARTVMYACVTSH